MSAQTVQHTKEDVSKTPTDVFFAKQKKNYGRRGRYKI